MDRWGSTATGLNAGTYIVTVRDNNGCTATQEYNITENTAIAAIPSQTAYYAMAARAY
ncbi:MAG: hypothetical protein IPP29_20820 [Bacteroidetes bacterium]|nr:hypothetical protein [Bacteroidota bacterium]